eukprot:2882051-Prymnesium_polylepis.1
MTDSVARRACKAQRGGGGLLPAASRSTISACPAHHHVERASGRGGGPRPPSVDQQRWECLLELLQRRFVDVRRGVSSTSAS